MSETHFSDNSPGPVLGKLDRFLFAKGDHHHIYQKLGAHLHQQDGVAGTVFAVWAPAALRVSVVGDFNEWDADRNVMNTSAKSGIWELFIPDLAEGVNYKYAIVGHDKQLRFKTDPYAFQMQVRPDTASVVCNLDGYQWNDQQWIDERARQNPLTAPINIYEVHPGSWKRLDGEFFNWEQLTAELIPYVVDMGYTHIELMGLAEHPLDMSWGYQVTGYYAATSRFGKPHELMHFIDQCHLAGIGVIMDWVPGHFPRDDFALAEFDGTCLYEHADPRLGEHREWGTKIFNYGRNEVRNFLVSNAVFWLDYYHLDGLRVDAVAAMIYLDYNRDEGQWSPNRFGGRENLEAIDFLRQLNGTIFNYFPGVLSIAEESTSFAGVSHPVDKGGLGFNFKWNMGWMNDTLRYISSDPIYRKYDGHLITFAMVYAWSENFILPVSHDEVVHGKGSLLSKMPGDDWQQRANFRAYVAFMLTHPGKNLLFMGQEFGQRQEWSEARSLDWHLLEYADHRQLQSLCRALNHFYRDHPQLYASDADPAGFEWIECNDSDHSVYAFLRHDISGTLPPLMCVFNFTPVPRDAYRLGLPAAGRWRKLFDSDQTQFGGGGYNQQETVTTTNKKAQDRLQSAMFNLPSLGVMIWQSS